MVVSPWQDPTGGPQSTPDAEPVRRAFESLSKYTKDQNDAVTATTDALDTRLDALEALNVGSRLISRQVLGSDTATVTFSSIPNTYYSLRVVWLAKTSNGTVTDLRVRFNSDTGANYQREITFGVGSTGHTDFGDNAATFISAGVLAESTNDNICGAGEFVVPAYLGGTFKTHLSGHFVSWDKDAPDLPLDGTAGGWWSTGAAVTTIALSSSAGNLKTGSSFSLYGLS